MDNEVIELFEKIIKRFGKLKRDMIPFEIFKLVTLYCTSQDIRGILGNTQVNIEFKNIYIFEHMILVEFLNY